MALHMYRLDIVSGYGKERTYHSTGEGALAFLATRGRFQYVSLASPMQYYVRSGVGMRARRQIWARRVKH